MNWLKRKGVRRDIALLSCWAPQYDATMVVESDDYDDGTKG